MSTPSSMDASTVPHDLRLLRAPWPRLLPFWGVLGVLSGTLGCSGDTTGPAPVSAAQAFWALQLDHHAVNLAITPPYDTVQLTAVPVNAAGTSLPGLGPVTYKAADSTVTVSATGLVTAHYQTTGGGTTRVVATLQDQGVTLADAVIIQVTSAPPPSPLATFSMQPAPGDSAKRSLDVGNFNWPVTATDIAGNTVCNGSGCPLQVYYTSSNPGEASIDRQSGAVNIHNDTGHVVFTATTLAYGVAWRDSVLFIIGYSINVNVPETQAMLHSRPVLVFRPAFIVGVGATVSWGQLTLTPPTPGLDSIDVVFDDSTAVQPAGVSVFGHVFPPTGGGNIPPFGFDSTIVNAFRAGTGSIVSIIQSELRARSFPIAGTYPYHSRLYHTTGTIIVRKDTPWP